MPTLNIFVSFEADKDKNLKNSFFQQAKTLTHHHVRNFSLNEAGPAQGWQQQARAAIEKCDVVSSSSGRILTTPKASKRN